jgi:transposase
MFSLTSSLSYYLYYGSTDMRKSFDSLCGLVQGYMGRNPVSGEVYIFINRIRNRIKLLHWEHGGFVLYYKRLESGTLELPNVDEKTKSMQVNWSTLVMMVEGISLEKTKRRKRFFINNQ